MNSRHHAAHQIGNPRKTGIGLGALLAFCAFGLMFMCMLLLEIKLGNTQQELKNREAAKASGGSGFPLEILLQNSGSAHRAG